MLLEHLIEKPTTSVCGGKSIAKGFFWGSHAYICIQGGAGPVQLWPDHFSKSKGHHLQN